MIEALPMIAYYDGVPISELPREELERLLIEASQKIEELQHDVMQRSIAHINDLARMRRHG